MDRAASGDKKPLVKTEEDLDRKDISHQESSTTNNSGVASHKSIRACSRKNRVYVFREFLWDTYGSQTINYVLDVAGGKGDLSWLLINADGAKSVVVDPRALASSSHLIRSVRWLEEHPKEASERSIPNLPTYQPLAALVPQILDRKQQNGGEAEYSEPEHLQLKLDNHLVEAVRQSLQEEASDNQCPRSWELFWDNREQSATSTAAETCFLPENERTQTTKSPIQDAHEAWKVFQNIELIAGFHPDQATEACVDLADLLHIPVCIVPCCVFPSEFPGRKLILGNNSVGDNDKKNGSSATTEVRVRDYETFLQYLQQKQPKLRKSTLAFHQSETSRNIVLYTLPEDT